MWFCRNLEELYLTGYQCCDNQRPDMSTVWPTAQTLRILVLDVLQDIKTLVRPAPGLRRPLLLAQRSLPQRRLTEELTGFSMRFSPCSVRWGITQTVIMVARVVK